MSEEIGSDGSVGPKTYFEGLFWTPVIERHTLVIAGRIARDQCGCGLWGLQRVGKTHFGEFLEKTLPGIFGGSLIVIRFQFIGQSFTKPEPLLKRALVNLGVRAITGRDAEALRLKLLSAIQARYLPHTKRVVLIWDEMQNVKEELWGELMFIEEAIRKDGLTPFQLSIGQPELQSTVGLVEKEGKLQAIGRMFQTADEFRGLFMQEIAEVLVELDGPDHAFTRKHFPARANAGWSIQRLIEPLQAAGDSLANWSDLKRALCMPASTLRQTLNAMFMFLDDPESPTKEVDKSLVLGAFRDNGFTRQFTAYSRQMPVATEVVAQ